MVIKLQLAIVFAIGTGVCFCHACNAMHGIAVAILSVRLSVHLSDVCVVTKLNDGLRLF